MIRQVYESFPDIGNHVSKMYLGFNDLIICQGNSTVSLSLQEGVHQGDPLGPALFSTAIHPVLLKVQSNHDDVTVLAYLDNIIILGLPYKIMSAFEDLKPSLSALGLEISNSKCEFYCPPSAGNVACEQFQSIPVSSHGCKILDFPLEIFHLFKPCVQTSLILEAFFATKFYIFGLGLWNILNSFSCNSIHL